MSVQQSLSGEETEAERARPSTFLWCEECGEWLLRRKRIDHEHALYESKGVAQEPDTGSRRTTDDQEEIDEPEQIGNWYTVTLSYSVDYRFRIPAYSKDGAERLAKDWQHDEPPSSKDHVHTRVSEGSEITEEDVPEDFTMGGSERLWEVLDA